jgi:hypothetical protein
LIREPKEFIEEKIVPGYSASLMDEIRMKRSKNPKGNKKSQDK